MGQEIGVDVERMHQLVAALENLRDALADNVPVIVNTLNEYWSGGTGQPISLLTLQQAPAKSHDDAAAIWARTRMAVTYQNQPDARLPDGMVAIPWDMSAKDQAEYEAGAQAARNLDNANQLTNADFENAIAQLARKAGNPYYAAGFFNSLNAQTLTQLINIMGVLGSGQDTSRIYQDWVTAMADGNLSRGAMSELANLLGSTSSDAFKSTPGQGIYVLNGEYITAAEFYAERYQLLEDIANNQAASANFIASTDSAQVQAMLKSFDPNSAPLCRSSAGIRSILRIMTNAVDSQGSPQTLTQPPPASALVASLSGDLKVLNAETLAQNDTELAAFMKAAVSKLTPPVPPRMSIADFANWNIQLWENMQPLKRLLESVGTAYENTQQSIHLQQAFVENVLLGALTPLIPIPGGEIAVGAGEGAVESLPVVQNAISKGMNYLIPDNLEGGAQAAVSAQGQVDEIMMVSGVVRIYEAARDTAGLQSLLASPYFWKSVNALATGGPPPPTDREWYKWYRAQTVPLSDDPKYPFSLALESLAGVGPKLPAQDLPPS
jgi:hypothetical protein